MTFRSIRLSRVLAAILCAGVMSAAVSVSADEIDNRRGGGYGMMGQGYGPGMMGQGYGMGHGPGMMYGWGQDRDLKLKADDARALVQARLVMLGNDRLTVGDVADDNADEIVVDVVTAKEKALVEKLAVDRATGRIRAVR